MPSQLRKRKEKAAPAKDEDITPAKRAKAAPAPKRKAADDASTASPIAAKKQKPVKDTAEPKTKANGAKTEKAAKKPKSKPAKAQEPEEEEPTQQPEDEEEVDDKTKALVSAFDSDDDDTEITTSKKSTFTAGQDVGKIPTTKKPTTSKDVAVTDSNGAKTGTVYVGRIPHGFYEHEMRAYFSQFGPITRLRLSRNKKTGASKHFAFIEFAEASTADIVAKTMDGYLLFGHILRCKLVPDSQIHEGLWKGANRRFKKVPWNKMAGKQLEKALPESKWEAKIEKEGRRRSARAEKLKDMGYEFEAPALKAAEAKPATIEAAKENQVVEGDTEANAIESPVAEEKTVEDAVGETEAVAKEEESAPVKEKKAKGVAKKKGKKAKA